MHCLGSNVTLWVQLCVILLTINGKHNIKFTSFFTDVAFCFFILHSNGSIVSSICSKKSKSEAFYVIVLVVALWRQCSIIKSFYNVPCANHAAVPFFNKGNFFSHFYLPHYLLLNQALKQTLPFWQISP